MEFRSMFWWRGAEATTFSTLMKAFLAGRLATLYKRFDHPWTVSLYMYFLRGPLRGSVRWAELFLPLLKDCYVFLEKISSIATCILLEAKLPNFPPPHLAIRT